MVCFCWTWFNLVEAGQGTILRKSSAFEPTSTVRQTFVASAKDDAPPRAFEGQVKQLIAKFDRKPKVSKDNQTKSFVDESTRVEGEVKISTQPEISSHPLVRSQEKPLSHEPSGPSPQNPDVCGERGRRFVPSDIRRSQGREGRLRRRTQGTHVPRGLEGSGVGEFHAVSVQRKCQDEPPQTLAVCGDHGGEAREGQPESASAQRAVFVKCLPASSHQECQEQATSGASPLKGARPQSPEPRRLSSSRCFGRNLSGRLRLGGHRGRRMDTRPILLSDYGTSSDAELHHRAADGYAGDAAADVELGECAEPSGPTFGAESQSNPGRRCSPVGGPDWEPETAMTADQKKLMLLVFQISLELEEVLEKQKACGPRWDVGEVFCGAQSPLTQQVIQQQGRAFRFGYDQGDLSTAEGRHVLFSLVAKYWPKHLWYSPVCGPWSAWSQLNASRSLEAWDQFCAQRRSLLYQIALGIVLYRHQLRGGDHFHWVSHVSLSFVVWSSWTYTSMPIWPVQCWKPKRPRFM